MRRLRGVRTKPSPRELQALELLSWGLSQSQVAEEMGVAEDTVKRYVQLALQLYGVHNRTAAVAAALRQGHIL